MRTLTYLMMLATPAFAQVSVEVHAPPPPRIEVHAPRVVAPPPPRIEVHAPSIRFEAPPPLEVVHPGVQVVADADEEVFFSAGCYWHRGPDGTWWRTRHYRGGWTVAPPRAVPVAVVHLRPGHYRHFHRELRHERHEVRREMRRRH